MNTFVLSLISVLIFLFIIYFTKKYFEYINPFVEEIYKDGLITDGDLKTGCYFDIKRTYKNGKIVFIRKNHNPSTKYNSDGNIKN